MNELHIQNTLHAQGANPQTGSPAIENSAEEEHGPPWEPGDWYSNCSDDSSTSAWCNSRYTASWRQFPSILPIIRRTLFWILVVHDQLDQERQSEGFRNMRCIMALQQRFVLAISLFVFANSGTETCRKAALFTFR